MRSAPTEGFSALARRLTGWYVLVAVAVAILLVAAVGVLGLSLYAREINDSIALLRSATPRVCACAPRSGNSRSTQAALEFEQTVRHEGIHSFATIPRAAAGPPPAAAAPRPPPPRPNGRYVDGVMRARPRAAQPLRRQPLRLRDRDDLRASVGPAAAVPGRRDRVLARLDRCSRTSCCALFGIGARGASRRAALAFSVGRFITQQAIRPLIDVTEALQRFAARDFRAQSIAVDGSSDFDVLAHAYNAAAAQVAAAFAERDAAEAQMRQFVADAGHELRTPLTIILGYIDLLRRADRRATSARSSSFRRSPRKAGGCARWSTTSSCWRSSRARTPSSEPFDVGRAGRRDRRRAARARSGRRFDIDAHVTRRRSATARELYEALANIVDNAIKYAPGSPIRVTTRRRRRSGGRDRDRRRRARDRARRP